MVGAQDELVFDGHSLVIERDATVLARAPGFEETLLVVDLDRPEAATVAPLADELEQMRRALVLGLRDYVRKNGFDEIVVSVSGGIDSAVTATLAVEALGPDHVHCVSMPSRYSSEGTRSDAHRLAENLGCDFRELPIEPVVEAFGSVLAGSFAGRDPDLAEGNQASHYRRPQTGKKKEASGGGNQVRREGARVRRLRREIGGRERDQADSEAKPE